jgi:hypothetical protein
VCVFVSVCVCVVFIDFSVTGPTVCPMTLTTEEVTECNKIPLTVCEEYQFESISFLLLVYTSRRQIALQYFTERCKFL